MRIPRSILTQDTFAMGPFTPDGKAVILSFVAKSGGADLALLRLDRPDAGTILSNDPGMEWTPAFSPDGQWLAFATDRSGRPEVVIARLIDDGKAARLSEQRLPVSTGFGAEPMWRRDGQEIVYAGGAGNNWWPNADHTKFVVIDAPHAKGQTFRVMTGWR